MCIPVVENHGDAMWWLHEKKVSQILIVESGIVALMIGVSGGWLVKEIWRAGADEEAIRNLRDARRSDAPFSRMKNE